MQPLLDIAPVRNVQAAYFELLQRYFGGPYEQMRKYNLSPVQVASDFSNQTDMVEVIRRIRPELTETFVDFWAVRQSIVDGYLIRSGSMKTFFGGDISPIVQLTHFSSTLLYTDTVVLQCPVLRLIPILELGQAREAALLLIKHALNVMRFEELANADVEPPILLVTGSLFAINEEYRKNFSKASEPYVLAQAKALTGREFANAGDLHEFISNIKTEEDAIGEITDPKRALFDSEWSGSLADQFHRQVQENSEWFQLPPTVSKAGFALHNLITGRMLQANEIVVLNSSIKATPLVSAPTSWQYLLWRYEFDAKLTNPETNPDDLLITNAIMTRDERKEIPLLSGLSVNSIVALRREGAMASLRDLMRKSVQRIDSASRLDLKEISKEVSSELGNAFDEHDRELSELKASRRRFYGVDVLSSIATGTLTLAGAATGNVALAVLGAASTVLVGSKSIPLLQETWRDIEAKSEQIKRSPAAILLRNLDK